MHLTTSIPGSGNGEFLFPSDVAVDKCNNVFVSDCDNNRIQVIKYNFSKGFKTFWYQIMVVPVT